MTDIDIEVKRARVPVWQVLEAAADKIERDGWAQGGVGCVLDAMGSLIGNGCESPAIEAACAQFRIAIGCRFIWIWNDAPGRTAAEVIAMLHAVAATEKARDERVSLPVREEVSV